MIVLNSTTKLQLVLSAGTADVDVNFNDRTTTAYGPSDSQQTAATATTNDICASPAASTSREINGFTVNIKTTGGTATIQKLNSSGAVTTIVWKGTVDVGDNLLYAHGDTIKVLDANGNLKVIEALDTPPLVATGFIRLTGVSYPNGILSNVNTGDNDFYTVPSGKRAIFSILTLYNNSAGNINYFPQVKISGTYYRLNTTLLVATGAASTAVAISYIAEAGEILSVNTATTNGANLFARIMEFDSTCPLYSAKLLSLANGNNTIYTVPSGKTAVLGDSNSQFFDLNAGGGQYVNASGGSRTIFWHVVPSGQSVGSGYIVTASTAVNDVNRSSLIVQPTLEAGDFINLNTNAATATQWAWVNVMETPV